MKKILSLICMICLMAVMLPTSASAQSPLLPATDTLTNTDTARLTLRIPGKFDVLTFQANYTKISGTASSSLILQGSLDGVNFVTIPGADTASVTDIAPTQAFIWELPRSNYLWYRIYGTTGGTQSGQLKALALYR